MACSVHRLDIAALVGRQDRSSKGCTAKLCSGVGLAILVLAAYHVLHLSLGSAHAAALSEHDLFREPPPAPCRTDLRDEASARSASHHSPPPP